MYISLDVEEGKWRYITDEEMAEIHRLVADSAKTHAEKNPEPKFKNLRSSRNR